MAKKSLILLNLAGLDPAKVKKIIEHLSDIDQILDMSRLGLTAFAFLTNKEINKIISLQRSSLFNNELRLIKEKKIKVIDVFDSSYPYLLRQVANPPPVLYLKGNQQLLATRSLAVVGSRNPTDYGKSVAYNFSHSLSRLGFTIVSGLARGIDTQAHKGVLSSDGLTIAVLGSGFNYIYPRQNEGLAQKISFRGLLLSEYSFNTPPLPENFPRRNRIISGLSRGVVVVEADKRSGALITANCALNQNREVFAVPGRIDSPKSKGPNSLIKEGAKLTDSVEDILEEMELAGVG